MSNAGAKSAAVIFQTGEPETVYPKRPTMDLSYCAPFYALCLFRTDGTVGSLIQSDLTGYTEMGIINQH